jgi:hypothetical protein
MTRERKKTIWDQLPNAVSGMRSPLSSAQQARSKMLWGRLRTGLPLRAAEQSRRLQLMKRLHMRFAKGRLELPVEQRRRDAQIAVVDSGGLAARGGDDRRRTTPKRHATTASRGLYQISSWLDARVGVIHPLAPLKLRWDSCTGFALVRAGTKTMQRDFNMQNVDIASLLSEKNSPRENDPSEHRPKRRRRDRARFCRTGRSTGRFRRRCSCSASSSRPTSSASSGPTAAPSRPSSP